MTIVLSMVQALKFQLSSPVVPPIVTLAKPPAEMASMAVTREKLTTVLSAMALMVSTPAPPSNESVPVPTPTRKASSPLPPSRVSLSAPPSSVSLPFPPVS
jgi:hypothetical protein